MNDLLDPPPEDRRDQSTRAADPTERPPASAPTTDHAIVAAFAAFYRAETFALVRFLAWIGARLPDAADIAQETMVDAFKGWQTIEHPRAWVRRVASRKYGRHLASAEEPVDQVDGRPLLPAHYDQTRWEQYREIERLLALLPARQRQVMAWTYDGYKPHEIAAELGITPEAVRSSLKFARRNLAQLIAADDDPR